MAAPCHQQSLPAEGLQSPSRLSRRESKLGHPTPLEVISSQSNQVEAPRIERLIGKSLSRRVNGPARPGKQAESTRRSGHFVTGGRRFGGELVIYHRLA